MLKLDELPRLDPQELRSEVVGADVTVPTPFGARVLTYCDYTASGRCLGFVERYLLGVAERYANTHTEDDVTGRSMTGLLHDAHSGQSGHPVRRKAATQSGGIRPAVPV